jgi:hypothetical protein
MEVGQGPNWGCSAKGKKTRCYLVTNANNERSPAFAFTSLLFEFQVAISRSCDHILLSHGCYIAAGSSQQSIS